MRKMRSAALRFGCSDALAIVAVGRGDVAGGNQFLPVTGPGRDPNNDLATTDPASPAGRGRFCELRVARAHLDTEIERLPKPPPGFSQAEWTATCWRVGSYRAVSSHRVRG